MQLELGDSLEVLKSLDDNSIDSVVTDPPYGLSAARNSGHKSKGGFMGKKWDYDVPSVELWTEVLRVLKPGGHLLSFGGTRTYHRMVVNIEDAGFEIRDQIQWLYGSGFPKSHNVGKKLDDWDGWGTALKPANEPIVLARKPLSEKTVVKNVLKWGTGAINIDACRIPTNDSLKPHGKITGGFSGGLLKGGDIGVIENVDFKAPQGRWPANLLLNEQAAEMLDAQSGELKTGARKGQSHATSNPIYGQYALSGVNNFDKST